MAGNVPWGRGRLKWGLANPAVVGQALQLRGAGSDGLHGPEACACGRPDCCSARPDHSSPGQNAVRVNSWRHLFDVCLISVCAQDIAQTVGMRKRRRSLIVDRNSDSEVNSDAA